MITKKKCKFEGCESTKIWSKGFCLVHIPKKPIKKKKSYISKISSNPKSIAKREEKKEKTLKLHTWFDILWNSEPHYSEISGKWLGHHNNSCFWHHILSKSSFKEAEFDRENLIRITPDEHAEVESNPTKFELINLKREKLKEKYKKDY